MTYKIIATGKSAKVDAGRFVGVEAYVERRRQGDALRYRIRAAGRGGDLKPGHVKETSRCGFRVSRLGDLDGLVVVAREASRDVGMHPECYAVAMEQALAALAT